MHPFLILPELEEQTSDSSSDNVPVDFLAIPK